MKDYKLDRLIVIAVIRLIAIVIDRLIVIAADRLIIITASRRLRIIISSPGPALVRYICLRLVERILLPDLLRHSAVRAHLSKRRNICSAVLANCHSINLPASEHYVRPIPHTFCLFSSYEQ